MPCVHRRRTCCCVALSAIAAAATLLQLLSGSSSSLLRSRPSFLLRPSYTSPSRPPPPPPCTGQDLWNTPVLFNVTPDQPWSPDTVSYSGSECCAAHMCAALRCVPSSDAMRPPLAGWSALPARGTTHSRAVATAAAAPSSPHNPHPHSSPPALPPSFTTPSLHRCPAARGPGCCRPPRGIPQQPHTRHLFGADRRRRGARH